MRHTRVKYALARMCFERSIQHTIEPSLPGTSERPDLEIILPEWSLFLDFTVSNGASVSYRGKTDQDVEKMKREEKEKTYKKAVEDGCGGTFKLFRMDVNGSFGSGANAVVKRVASMMETTAGEVKDVLVKTCVCAAGRSLRLWRMTSRAWNRSEVFERRRKRRKKEEEETEKAIKAMSGDVSAGASGVDGACSQSSLTHPSVSTNLAEASCDEEREEEEDVFEEEKGEPGPV